ncbi:MAG: peptide deformylase [Candidatus Saccharimonas aalborgensis]
MRDREPIEKISVPRLDLIDPVEHAGFLNSRSAEVAEEEVSSKEIQWIIDEMLRMAAGKGKDGEDTRQMVGLAAPQVGQSKRIITIDVTATGANQEQHLLPIINPRISMHGEKQVDGREGCWSCANYCANVPRFDHIELEGWDRNGAPIQLTLDGFVARIAQHEVDHIDGFVVLIVFRRTNHGGYTAYCRASSNAIGQSGRTGRPHSHAKSGMRFERANANLSKCGCC